MTDPVILIPAYEPDERLLELVKRLKCRFSRIVIVDDGSVKGAEIITEATHLVEKVLKHSHNQGKGCALKTGFEYIGSNDVITVDCDGQHRPEDIERLAEALKNQREGLVIGSRRFSGMPFRSIWGGWWTRWIYRLFTGIRVMDTQSGLRGIPAGLVSRVAKLSGTGYEYEMAVLADARHHRQKPLEIPIDTVYIDKNSSSHFSPIRDTIKIYGALVNSTIFMI